MGQAERDRRWIRDTRTVLPLDVLTTDSCLLHHYSPTHIPTNPDGLEEQGVSHRCLLCLVPKEVLPPSLPTHPSTLSWLIGSESPTLLGNKEQKLPPGGPQADRQAGTRRVRTHGDPRRVRMI